MSVEDQKKRAALGALELVEPGMKLGLGTGSTAERFVEALGERVAQGLDVVCVPTSQTTADQAQSLGIKLTTLDDVPFLDLTVDGADEIDNQLRLIKGGGGALLREKIVACASDRMAVIADGSKLVKTLGGFALPIEVTRFGIRVTMNMIEVLAAETGCVGEIKLRETDDGKPFITDNGNLIFDCAFGQISEPELLAAALQMVPGCVEQGLFLGIADIAFIADEEDLTVLCAEDDEDDTR